MRSVDFDDVLDLAGAESDQLRKQIGVDLETYGVAIRKVVVTLVRPPARSAASRSRAIPILAGYTASKLPWTRKHRPRGRIAELATILLPHDYLNFWLTGERFMRIRRCLGHRLARCAHAALVARTAGRDRSRSRSCAVPAAAGRTGHHASRSCAAIADELGLPHDVRIAVGGGDNMMAAIGTGNVVPGRLAMSLGTSGTLFAYADTPVVDANGGWAAFCSSTGGWLPLICTMNCTVATETVARAVRLQAPATAMR